MVFFDERHLPTLSIMLLPIFLAGCEAQTTPGGAAADRLERAADQSVPVAAAELDSTAEDLRRAGDDVTNEAANAEVTDAVERAGDAQSNGNGRTEQ